MPHFALRGLGAVFDLSEQRRLDPDSPVPDLLGVGLRFPDLWYCNFQPGAAPPSIIRLGGAVSLADNKFIRRSASTVRKVRIVTGCAYGTADRKRNRQPS